MNLPLPGAATSCLWPLSPTQLWIFLLKENGEPHCSTDFLRDILDITWQETPFDPIKMKLKVAMSCGNDLVLWLVAGC